MEKIQRRKSSLDVDAAANTITSIMFVGILLAVFLFVILTVFGLSIFTGSNQNATFTTIQTSIIGMVTNFFALMPTVGTIMAVVILIAGIVILVLYVKNMRNAGSGGQMTG